jgi:hypothetical protein
MRHLVNWFKISSVSFLARVVLLTSTSADALDMKAWEGSINPETKERYISVELSSRLISTSRAEI